MGQLERYGLYVLSLVIVLILGVAIWGEPIEPATPGEGAPATSGDGSTHAAALQGQGTPRDQRPTIDQEVEAGLPGADSFFESVRPVEGTPASDPVANAPEANTSPASSTPAPRRSAEPVRNVRTYTVKQGDTMERIAQRELGGKRYTSKIAEMNGEVDPRLMQPGTVLKLPTRDELEKSGRSGSRSTQLGGGTYLVRRGDSPAKISLAVYGTETHAQRIMEANNITDPRKLQVDTELQIPVIR